MPRDVNNREPLDCPEFIKNIKGKLCGDKGYIGQILFDNLFMNGIQLITKIKKNIKNVPMSTSDKIILRKRTLIENVNDERKNMAQVEHSIHRSVDGFIANALGEIAAYCYFPKKPSSTWSLRRRELNCLFGEIIYT